MTRLRHHDDRQGGQILILFALVLVGILLSASIVVDLGVLRNNRQILVNTVDAAALAGGTKMPVDGAIAGKATAANNLVVGTIQANYPSLSSSDYSITYKCLIGVDPATQKPYISRDIPTWNVNSTAVCNPGTSLGWTAGTTLAQKEAAFVGAGATRYSSCVPADPNNAAIHDKCNVVVVTGSATTPYSFGRVVGITSGSSGSVMSAACNGPCGAPPSLPVDVVLVMDRTLSMSAADIADIQAGANALLSVFDTAIQRVALGTIGPSNPGLGACPSGSTSPLKGLGSPANQVYGVGTSPASNVNYFAYPADLTKWIPVGFSGTDGATPAVTFNEAYSSGGSTNTSSTIWKAISCFYSYTQGTNLDTPMSMAQQYLATNGRTGVKKGIIFETDGTPQAGDGSAHYTCNAANNTATAAKAAGIEVFTIGFGIDTAKCPTRSGSVCSGSTGVNGNESASWSCQPATTILTSMATDASHFYNAPDSTTLKNAFAQAAAQLAGAGSRLVQLYPTPIITAIAPALGTHLGGTVVTITGKFFTGATGVKFGATPAASFTVVSDTSITATSPVGTTGTTVDITVITPGDVSPNVAEDQYTYN